MVIQQQNQTCKEAAAVNSRHGKAVFQSKDIVSQRHEKAEPDWSRKWLSEVQVDEEQMNQQTTNQVGHTGRGDQSELKPQKQLMVLCLSAFGDTTSIR